MFAALAAATVVLIVMVTTGLLVRWVGSLGDPAIAAPTAVPFLGGHPPETHAWGRFHARWYPMALLFVAFEMEMMFMYPWAVVFVREGAKALAEMGMFLGILSLGVVYAWREGAFRWQ